MINFSHNPEIVLFRDAHGYAHSNIGISGPNSFRGIDRCPHPSIIYVGLELRLSPYEVHYKLFIHWLI
jgi:hypothetical protein